MSSVKHQYFTEIKTFCMAFILACGLWYVVVGNAHLVGELVVPVEYRSLPKNFVLVDGATPNIEVEIMATPELLNSLQNRILSYKVDLSTVKHGSNVIPITVDDVVQGVDVLKVEPSYLVVEVDTVTRKNVPIYIDFTHNENEDLQISNVAVSPSTVDVTGPSSLLKDVTFISVPFDVNKLDDEGRYSRSLQLSAPKGLKLGMPITTLSFEVETEKTVINVNKPIILEKMPAGLKLNPRSIELILEVAAGAILDDVLEPTINTQIRVSVIGNENVQVGQTLPVQIVLPKNITVLEINPSLVTVEVLNP